MTTTIKIITIGNAGKGGYWYSISSTDAQTGFETEAEAEHEAMAACSTPWELWYRCVARDGRTMMVPGAKSADHPENN